MAIQDLTAIVQPPDEPLEPGKLAAWRSIQSKLGLALPDDLRDYGLAFGTGRFCGTYIQVFNPFSNEYRGLIDFQCDWLRDLKNYDMFPPYDVYPDSPGLLPWGRDENGHSMFWFTKGAPENWPIVLRRRENEYEEWSMTMTNFLAQVLGNKIKCILWPEKFTKKHRVFQATTR